MRPFPKSSVAFRWWIEPFSRVVITEQEKRRWKGKNRRESSSTPDPDKSNPTGRLANHELSDMEIAELAVISKNPVEFMMRIENRSYDERKTYK